VLAQKNETQANDYKKEENVPAISSMMLTKRRWELLIHEPMMARRLNQKRESK
jgi:hypothetical protein